VGRTEGVCKARQGVSQVGLGLQARGAAGGDEGLGHFRINRLPIL